MTDHPRFRDSDDPAEPMTAAEIDVIRSTFRYYNRASLIPRLVATIDSLRHFPGNPACECDTCFDPSQVPPFGNPGSPQ